MDAPHRSASAYLPATEPAGSFDDMLSLSDAVFAVARASSGEILYTSPNASTALDMEPSALLGCALHLRAPKGPYLRVSVPPQRQTRQTDRACICRRRLHSSKLWHPEAVPTVREMLSSVRDAEPDTLIRHEHLRRRTSSGGWVWTALKLSCDGEYAFAMLRDVTEEKNIEQLLHSFLLTTSHDLRTPVHSMQCAVSLLEARADVAAVAEAAELLRVVRSSCKSMAVTSTNVLDLRHFEADKRPAAQQTKCVPFNVRALFAEVLETCGMVSHRQIDWHGVAHQLPERLEGDADLTRRILHNLAAACLRSATPSDVPCIAELSCDQDILEPAPAGSVLVTARFTSPGRQLSGVEMATVFDTQGGCGSLGLYVAQGLARTVGGDVTLQSDGSGTRVSATMRMFLPGAPNAPATVQARQDDASPPPEEGDGQPVPPALELTSRMFTHLVDHSDVMLHRGIVHPDGRAEFTFISTAATRVYGWKAEEVVGRSPGDFTHPDDRDRIGHCLLEALKQVRESGAEHLKVAFPPRRFQCKDGSWRWINSMGWMSSTAWCVVCKDISSRFRRESALRTLLLCISAELREPANAIIAACSLLSQHVCVHADADASFLLDSLHASCSLQLCMIANVSSMRSIETGQLALTPAPFDPRAAVDAVLKVCRVNSPQTRIVWTDEQQPLPAVVEGSDRGCFCQIFQNLLTNAIKFEAGGGVRVTVRCEPAIDGLAGTAADGGSATHLLRAAVADCGRGLSEEDAKSVFDAYEAAPPAMGGGTGLGLFVARSCARAAGGDVSVQSSPGHGATFELRLPVRLPGGAPRVTVPGAAPTPAPQPPPVAAAPTSPDAALRVLLVDDHALNLRLVKRLLEQAGFEVQTAADGEQALTMLVTAFQEGTPPHLALVDMMMPKLSGPEAVRAFRTWEQNNRADQPRLPCICFTANVLDEQRDECIAAGFDHVLTKPLHADAITILKQRAKAHAALLPTDD